MSEHHTTLPVTAVSTGCGCSDAGAHADPVLDARTIPHAIRHGAIFGCTGLVQRRRSDGAHRTARSLAPAGSGT